MAFLTKVSRGTGQLEIGLFRFKTPASVMAFSIARRLLSGRIGQPTASLSFLMLPSRYVVVFLAILLAKMLLVD